MRAPACSRSTSAASRWRWRSRSTLEREVRAKMLGYVVRRSAQSLLLVWLVTEVVLERLPATLLLTAGAFSFAVLIGMPIGVISAVKRLSLWDHGSMALALL